MYEMSKIHNTVYAKMGWVLGLSHMTAKIKFEYGSVTMRTMMYEKRPKVHSIHRMMTEFRL